MRLVELANRPGDDWRAQTKNELLQHIMESLGGAEALLPYLPFDLTTLRHKCRQRNDLNQEEDFMTWYKAANPVAHATKKELSPIGSFLAQRGVDGMSIRLVEAVLKHAAKTLLDRNHIDMRPTAAIPDARTYAPVIAAKNPTPKPPDNTPRFIINYPIF